MSHAPGALPAPHFTGRSAVVLERAGGRHVAGWIATTRAARIGAVSRRAAAAAALGVVGVDRRLGCEWATRGLIPLAVRHRTRLRTIAVAARDVRVLVRTIRALASFTISLAIRRSSVILMHMSRVPPVTHAFAQRLGTTTASGRSFSAVAKDSLSASHPFEGAEDASARSSSSCAMSSTPNTT